MPKMGTSGLGSRRPCPYISHLLESFAGGPVDVEWLQESPRVGAIMTAWYPGEMARALLIDSLHTRP